MRSKIRIRIKVKSSIRIQDPHLSDADPKPYW
jgi:hypothetical protein